MAEAFFVPLCFCRPRPLAAPAPGRYCPRMQWWPVGFVLFAAALLPAQAACNAAMNRALGQPMAAVMVSILGSLAAVAAFGLISGRLYAVSLERLAAAPWWAWAAGLGGAFFVAAQAIVVPRIGAAMFTTLAVTGQVAMALLLDHLGALNLPQHSASPMRILGAVLIVAGMALVARF